MRHTVTRRVAIAILATVWVTLVVGGCFAYWTTRAMLLADLDDSLRARALSLPLVAGGANGAPIPLHASDRYLIQNEVGRTVARSVQEPPLAGGTELIDATFVRLPGSHRLRRIALRTSVAAAGSAGGLETVTIVFSGSAESFDRVLSRLALALAGTGLLSGLAATLVAVHVSRAALRPLHSAADVIAMIDERSLDRRLDAESLPPELSPLVDRTNDMLGRLGHAFAQRRQFLADASHELRTPVAALLSTLQVSLRRPRTEQALRAVLAHCLTDVKMLWRLVERLLEQVHTEQRSSQDKVEEVEAATALAACAHVARQLALNAQVEVITDLSPGLWLRVDADRLRSMMLNLLSNAVEHNRPAGTVQLRTEETPGGGVKLIVADTGGGIAAEHLPHIFEPFYRAHGARSQTGDRHLGLGLYLAQSHAVSMGGRIEVASEVGRGTRFTVVLPPDAVSRRQGKLVDVLRNAHCRIPMD